jgi:spore germination cell wall hydrolase CwlJ-like protein
MIRFLGNRGASAVTGFFLLALASSEAAAAPAATAVALTPASVAQSAAAPASAYAKALAVPTAAATAVATVTGSVVQTQAASAVSLKLAPEIAKEAAWLYSNGWPLYALVDRYKAGAPLDKEANCVATAVYHEARGESLEGQLAVARVIMNRAASGKYPSTWCGTVKQPYQFSFVNPHTGAIPYVDQASDSWAKAVAITRLAVSNAVPSLDSDVLWYHASYVAPSWGHRLNRVEKIGTHIFYRA